LFLRPDGRNKWRLAAYAATGVLLLASGGVFAARISDVRGTKHNLSATPDGSAYAGGTVPSRTVKATTETQVCVFCHTPHGATLGVTPLWNRQLSSATYVPYTSSSLDANVLQGTLDQPGGSSKLCLSCHDGTLALGNVNVLNGLGSPTTPGTETIEMTGTDTGGVMAPGSGTTTGYTRNLGVDLTNDHPISVSYTSALADRDGELRPVDANQQYPAGMGTIIGLRSLNLKPKAPLEPTGAGGVGQVQCAACHDPHLRETNPAEGNQKFLRLNRFQAATPAPIYDSASDINCVACHDKDQSGGSWIYSVHANPQIATQTYTDTAASQREFPRTTDGAPTNLKVWQASCLNCHDTHAVQGSRRLLREGTDSTAIPKAGGGAALEETCFQCHSNDATTAITPLTGVADIKSDYTLIGGKRMPIRSSEQPAGTEVHDIGGNFPVGGMPTEWVDCSSTTNKCGADFVERRAKLGAGNLSNRHAECSDCHNPHRAVKFNTFAPASLAATPDASGTHKHLDAPGYTHTNIASGALRGTFGVEPVYGSASFQNLPSSYEVKRGDPGVSTSTLTSAPYVTREYQICLKCHSDYGYSDNNLTEFSSDRPPLQTMGGSLTPAGTNGLNFYTNQAKEFQAPFFHKGELPNVDSGAAAAYANGAQMNYRSWHPVMDSTGRTAAIRGGITATTIFTLPWSNDVGNQTMYCDDCHGSNVTSATSVIPDPGKPWGSHGSANNFILKGEWNSATGTGQTNGLCFKCHDYGTYAGGGGGRTGFWLGADPLPPNRIDGHTLHYNKIGRMVCTWCHVAVPHGWKNKGLLVNLNDVGPEGGQVAGTQVRNNTTTAYTQAPYYLNAVLKVINFKPSGQWSAADCGSPGAPGNGRVGLTWMKGTGNPADTTENCATPP
jgi:formate-dependent nitrite reductase cytochrome c552 subunit